MERFEAKRSRQNYNPADETIVGAVQNVSSNDAIRALAAAEKAQKLWKRIPAPNRADILRKFTVELRKNKADLAALITAEQGKSLKVSEFDVEVTCSFIEYACGY